MLENALPYRFTAYVALAAAVIVALWTATAKGRIYRHPYVLPMLAVAALVPAAWHSSSFHSHPQRWAFFSDGAYKRCIPRGETVAIFPLEFESESLLWQAETGFWFRLVADSLQPPTESGKALNSFYADPVIWQLNFVTFARPTMDRLLAFAALHHVDRVLSVASGGYPSGSQMQAFGPTQLVGGMLVAPACGQPSLASRNLASYVARYRQAERAQCRTSAGATGPTFASSQRVSTRLARSRARGTRSS